MLVLSHKCPSPHLQSARSLSFFKTLLECHLFYGVSSDQQNAVVPPVSFHLSHYIAFAYFYV